MIEQPINDNACHQQSHSSRIPLMRSPMVQREVSQLLSEEALFKKEVPRADKSEITEKTDKQRTGTETTQTSHESPNLQEVEELVYNTNESSTEDAVMSIVKDFVDHLLDSVVESSSVEALDVISLPLSESDVKDANIEPPLTWKEFELTDEMIEAENSAYDEETMKPTSDQHLNNETSLCPTLNSVLM